MNKPKRNYPKCDHLGRKKDGLKWFWKWPKWEKVYECWQGGPGYQVAKARKPIVVDYKMDVTLTCIRWADDEYSYEGTVSIAGNRVCSTSIPFKKGLSSRLDAQRAAEKLCLKLGKELVRINE